MTPSPSSPVLSSESPMARALNLTEVLENVISHIDKYDVKTQHSALLVNRKWCKIASPYLWSTPFSYNISDKRLCKIIPIYLSFVSSDVIDYLAKNDVKMLTENGRGNKNTCRTFDYPKFMRSLNVDFLADAVIQWLQEQNVAVYETESDSSCGDESSDDEELNGEYSSVTSEDITDETSSDEDSDYDTSLYEDQNLSLDRKNNPEIYEIDEYLVSELCKLFMNKSRKILELSIVDLSIDGTFINKIPSYPGNSCLSHLEILEFDGSFCNRTFVIGLASLCKNLTTIVVDDMDEDTPFVEELSTLIRNQSCLLNFSLSDIPLDMSKVITALDSQVDSLKNIVIRDVLICDKESIKALSHCVNVESIDLSFEDKKYYKSFTALWYSTFPKLKQLGISMYYTWQDPLFIENTKAFLELNGKHLYGINLCLTTTIYTSILQGIGVYCPKLSALEINRIYDGVGHLIELLKMPLPLKKIVVEYNKSKLHQANGALPPLRDLKALENLTHFEIGWIFSARFLEEILKGWEAPIQKFSYCSEDEFEAHKKILNEFVERISSKYVIKDHNVTSSPFQRIDRNGSILKKCRIALFVQY
ncbi:3937_t:CDS:2 [Acaulospora morrowiae]|uniref:3937_t:CDS:1 n=1 Tax=Acaulospora morrowiae TaxID=94023 RepID=A0A9N9H6L8_9GLOM|nr:3937_t:CDS:2 [Acaulospora morrowiae]